MSKLFRSKAGFATAGLYLLVTLPFIAATAVFFLVRYYNNNQPVPPFEEPLSIVSFALTLPWSIGVTILGIIIHGGQGMHTGRLVIIIGLVVSAIINALILYLLAFGVSSAVKHLYNAGNPKPKP
ncbi:MAG: hypothetical protein IPM21_18100 [Acidobacteria bacterium]|nr:hypothetical protein [Acidobacteriota bacterium]